VKVVIDLIPAKHNLPEDLYQSNKIVADLIMDYEKLMPVKKLHVILEGAQG
jgi:hypothetical protein